jgi:disulfide bond formation protein DsbB
MTDTPAFRLAQKLALGVPALLLGGAYISEYGFGLFPCEMCWWQRWPHFAAVVLAFLGFFVAPKRMWVALAALAILASGVIGGFHAGVEYNWWEGITGCATTDVRSVDVVRCDVAPWSLLGVSLAGWNFLISTGSAIMIFVLLGRSAKAGNA